MKAPAKIAVVLAVVAAAAAAVVLKNSKSHNSSNPTTPVVATDSTPPAADAKLPKLLDLGAGKCIPCKMMVPILEELKKEYAGKMTVEFIDVWQNEDAGKEYGVEMIPTQIFFDAEGKELFRHTGFFGKEDILAKWKELGVDLSGGKPSAGIVRETPVAADTRPPDSVCFMGDRTIDPKMPLGKDHAEQHAFACPTATST
ncbi:MAG: thioredoxin family protein [Akkermansiaceae bacterium]|nr:thioredoxin family protein [Akkermansiaceae bacterium]MCF7730039.1 thioredoxin family protein [Akkermansiaceae bacterium]